MPALGLGRRAAVPTLRVRARSAAGPARRCRRAGAVMPPRTPTTTATAMSAARGPGSVGAVRSRCPRKYGVAQKAASATDLSRSTRAGRAAAGRRAPRACRRRGAARTRPEQDPHDDEPDPVRAWRTPAANHRDDQRRPAPPTAAPRTPSDRLRPRSSRAAGAGRRGTASASTHAESGIRPAGGGVTSSAHRASAPAGWRSSASRCALPGRSTYRSPNAASRASSRRRTAPGG